MRAAGAWLALFSLVACLHLSLGGELGVDAAPTAGEEKRAAEDLWRELTEGEGRASDHEHWERILRRSAAWYNPYYEDETRHIVDVQDYYRYVLEQEDWYVEPQPEQDLARVLQEWRYPASIQLENDNPHIEKPIAGRYIVMLDSAADDATLDRTLSVLQRAHAESDGLIRTEHITPLRNIGVGFTATMNRQAVALVS